jgi:hypothetical protein
MLAVTLSAASLVAVILPDDQPTLSNRAPWLESYLGAVVVIGLLSMVVIQMAKDFSPVRRWFQRPWIKKWIKHRLPPGQVANPPQAEVQKVWSVEDVEERLLLGAGEVRGRYLYNLPVEQLCGQINVALQAALENPKENEGLIRVFARTASDNDLKVFLSPRPSLVVRDDMSVEERKEIEEYAQARNHVAHHVERAVDGLQIAMGSRWKLLLQSTSIGLCLFFAWLGIGMGWTSTHHGAAVKDILAIGLVAGYLAPVARDILARIQQGSR